MKKKIMRKRKIECSLILHLILDTKEIIWLDDFIVCWPSFTIQRVQTVSMERRWKSRANIKIFAVRYFCERWWWLATTKIVPTMEKRNQYELLANNCFCWGRDLRLPFAVAFSSAFCVYLFVWTRLPQRRRRHRSPAGSFRRKCKIVCSWNISPAYYCCYRDGGDHHYRRPCEHVVRWRWRCGKKEEIVSLCVFHLWRSVPCGGFVFAWPSHRVILWFYPILSEK